MIWSSYLLTSVLFASELIWSSFLLNSVVSLCIWSTSPADLVHFLCKIDPVSLGIWSSCWKIESRCPVHFIVLSCKLGMLSLQNLSSCLADLVTFSCKPVFLSCKCVLFPPSCRSCSVFTNGTLFGFSREFCSDIWSFRQKMLLGPLSV